MYAGFTAHYGPEQETFTAIGTLTFKHTYVYVCVCVCRRRVLLSVSM